MVCCQYALIFIVLACYQDFLMYTVVAFPQVAPCNSEVLLLIYSSLMVFAKYFEFNCSLLWNHVTLHPVKRQLTKVTLHKYCSTRVRHDNKNTIKQGHKTTAVFVHLKHEVYIEYRMISLCSVTQWISSKMYRKAKLGWHCKQMAQWKILQCRVGTLV